MGGALAFAAASTGANLDAILPFYGIPKAEYFDISKIKIPVLAQFGSLDKHAGFSDVEVGDWGSRV
jgi:dienelactone hydrolase